MSAEHKFSPPITTTPLFPQVPPPIKISLPSLPKPPPSVISLPIPSLLPPPVISFPSYNQPPIISPSYPTIKNNPPIINPTITISPLPIISSTILFIFVNTPSHDKSPFPLKVPTLNFPHNNEEIPFLS